MRSFCEFAPTPTASQLSRFTLSSQTDQPSGSKDRQLVCVGMGRVQVNVDATLWTWRKFDAMPWSLSHSTTFACLSSAFEQPKLTTLKSSGSISGLPCERNPIVPQAILVGDQHASLPSWFFFCLTLPLSPFERVHFFFLRGSGEGVILNVTYHSTKLSECLTLSS